jgi:hypothetical protein
VAVVDAGVIWLSLTSRVRTTTTSPLSIVIAGSCRVCQVK